MKKFLAITIMFCGLSVFADDNTNFMPSGDYRMANTPDEGVTTVTTSAYYKSSAVNYGVERYYQNTSNNTLNFFAVVSDSTTVGLATLSPGEKWVCDRFFGDLYFLGKDGVCTLFHLVFKNK